MSMIRDGGIGVVDKADVGDCGGSHQVGGNILCAFANGRVKVKEI